MSHRRKDAICMFCGHYIGITQSNRQISCVAFPNGIPRDIYPIEQNVKFDHRYPHPDDNGIQIESQEDYEKRSKFRPIRMIMHLYNDESKIREYLDGIFEEYDDLRDRGFIKPSWEELEGNNP